MKKIVIKNKFRFICFLLVVFTLLSILLVSVSDFGKVYSKSYDRFATYFVESGDTLWEIAEKNNINNKDLRKLIFEIRELNGIDSNLYIGQEIIIPL